MAGGVALHAMIENRETCAAMDCCQPVEKEIAHRVGHPEDPEHPLTTVRIGYCAYHAARIRRMRKAMAQ